MKLLILCLLTFSPIVNAQEAKNDQHSTQLEKKLKSDPSFRELSKKFVTKASELDSNALYQLDGTTSKLQPDWDKIKKVNETKKLELGLKKQIVSHAKKIIQNQKPYSQITDEHKIKILRSKAKRFKGVNDELLDSHKDYLKSLVQMSPKQLAAEEKAAKDFSYNSCKAKYYSLHTGVYTLGKMKKVLYETFDAIDMLVEDVNKSKEMAKKTYKETLGETVGETFGPLSKSAHKYCFKKKSKLYLIKMAKDLSQDYDESVLIGMLVHLSSDYEELAKDKMNQSSFSDARYYSKDVKLESFLKSENFNSLDN